MTRFIKRFANILFLLIKKLKTSHGYTLYRPIGLKKNFSHIDLDKKQATCVVAYKEKTYLTVQIDLKQNTVNVDRSMNLNLETSEDDIIHGIKMEAEFFIQQGITNPKEYYASLLKSNGEGK